MKQLLPYCIILLIVLIVGCGPGNEKSIERVEETNRNDSIDFSFELPILRGESYRLAFINQRLCRSQESVFLADSRRYDDLIEMSRNCKDTLVEGPDTLKVFLGKYPGNVIRVEIALEKWIGNESHDTTILVRRSI